MTREEKLKLDLGDLWRIHDGLAMYVNLDAKGVMDRLKAHREDYFCQVTDYAGDGKSLCTRAAYDAIDELAKRHRQSMPVPDDYSVVELSEGIRKHVVRAMVDEKEDEPSLARVLVEAENDAKRRHVERTYHFPCVVVPYEEPPQFRIGIVTFTSAKAFPQAFASGIQRCIKTDSDPPYMTKRVEGFHEYTSAYGWIVSVTVPPCAPESAKRRAEVAVAVAVDLLRLVFGVGYGRDMRVVHLAYTQPHDTEYAVTENGELRFISSGKSSGALVEKDWYLQMDTEQGFWNQAAHLVNVTVSGERSEIANRLIDALTWFGKAAFESAPGTQIVIFVAALERLTTTESFSTRRFCSRVAMLAHNSESDFERTYWDAYATHTARSEVIHGGYSPTSTGFLKILRSAHDLTRNALFRGLEVHGLLDDRGPTSSLADLRDFFAKQQSKHALALKKLDNELKTKKKNAASERAI